MPKARFKEKDPRRRKAASRCSGTRFWGDKSVGKHIASGRQAASASGRKSVVAAALLWK